MKAVLVHETNGELYIGNWEQPTPTDDELLVNVKATALNRADLLQRTGNHPPPLGASPILGLEMAGVIEQVGKDVSGWKPGDRVCGLLPGGGYAEKAVIPAGLAIRIPDHFSFEQAAAIPEVFLTAYLNMFMLGQLKPGETVLIHAGASGVGTAAIQLAREAGVTSIVTAGSELKRATCLGLGASLAIDYRTESFTEQVRIATEGRGVDVVLDFIGASYWEQNIESLAVNGRLILIGRMGGTIVEKMDISPLMTKRIQVIGSTLRSRSVEDKISLTKQFCQFALERFEDGRLKPIIDSIWNVSQVNEAHEYMKSNQNTGKIILRMNP